MDSPYRGSKSTFALFFGNRGFFPAALQKSARAEMESRLRALGHKTLTLDFKATRNGAVETPEEGERYARFLRENRGRFEGVILSLPNFGDENGAVAALRDAGVPILVQAYPDELDRMAPADRRDSFCGKFSIMDLFHQCAIPFTALPPHTVRPSDRRFADNIDYFDRLCRVAAGLRRIAVGAIGARTTAFKTVRIDEVALQRRGITVETIDLSDVFARVRAVKPSSKVLAAKIRVLDRYSSWAGAPKKTIHTLAALGVALDDIIQEYKLDAISVRCWTEMQQQLNVSPCVLLSDYNNRGVAAACEVDVGNAVMMRGLQLAAGAPAALMDWNNNYGDDDNKCILFHCGAAPRAMMSGPGRISDHAIISNAVGKGRSYGCNVGRIRPMPFTYGSLMTESGAIKVYTGQGHFTDDPIPDDFFGCAGVAEIVNLQSVLQTIGYAGYRHHVSLAGGHVAAPLGEALQKYLGYQVAAV